jgi:hypothetical protein
MGGRTSESSFTLRDHYSHGVCARAFERRAKSNIKLSSAPSVRVLAEQLRGRAGTSHAGRDGRQREVCNIIVPGGPTRAPAVCGTGLLLGFCSRSEANALLGFAGPPLHALNLGGNRWLRDVHVSAQRSFCGAREGRGMAAWTACWSARGRQRGVGFSRSCPAGIVDWGGLLLGRGARWISGCWLCTRAARPALLDFWVLALHSQRDQRCWILGVVSALAQRDQRCWISGCWLGTRAARPALLDFWVLAFLGVAR